MFPLRSGHHGTREGTYTHSILIKGGTVLDGTGSPPARLDVAVDGARISGLYRHSDAKAAVTIDATGKMVCPGFIDIHSHSDLHLLGNPLAESKVLQGVTTEVVGNCGTSGAPLNGSARGYAEDVAEDLCVEVDWTTMDEYLLRLHNIRTSVNVATLVGAENIRRAVLGERDVKPSQEDLDRMKRMVADAVLQGAFGLSTGLIYAPGCFASTDEISSLAAVSSSLGGMYASHIRGEGRTLVKAVQEAITIGRTAGVRVQISHHKACGTASWGRVRETIAMIERARSGGVDVAFDVYPYTASCTSLDSILPPWARDGGKRAVVERARDPQLRPRLAREMETPSEEWEASAAEIGWDRISVIDLKTKANKRFENMTVAAVAKALGKEPADAALDLIAEEDDHVSAIYHEISEDDVVTVISNPLAAIGSDGCAERAYGPCSSSAVHPRSFGTFPRVIRRYVIEKKVLTMEEAVRKMTSLPAGRLGLEDRGTLAPGMAADVVVFDPQRIRDLATFDDPRRYPEGIDYVIVNGAITVEHGQHTRERAGLVLRHRPSIA